MSRPKFQGWPFKIIRYTILGGVIDMPSATVVEDTHRIHRANLKGVRFARAVLETCADRALNGLTATEHRTYRFYVSWFPNRLIGQFAQTLHEMEHDLWDSCADDTESAAAKGLDL